MNYKSSSFLYKGLLGFKWLKYPFGFPGSFMLAGLLKQCLSKSNFLSKSSWSYFELGTHLSPNFLDKYESDFIIKKEIVADANITVTRYKNSSNPVVSGYVEKSSNKKKKIKKKRENSFFIGLMFTSACFSILKTFFNYFINYLKWLIICQLSWETSYV